MPACLNEEGAFKDINRNMFPFGVNAFRCTKMSTVELLKKLPLYFLRHFFLHELFYLKILSENSLTNP